MYLTNLWHFQVDLESTTSTKLVNNAWDQTYGKKCVPLHTKSIFCLHKMLHLIENSRVSVQVSDENEIVVRRAAKELDVANKRPHL